MAHDYSVVEDAQASVSRFSKNWADNESLVWELLVVEHCRTGLLPFGVVRLRGSFDGVLTIALREADASSLTEST